MNFNLLRLVKRNMQTVTNPSDLHLRTTVAIVGGGPVGLILSQLLSQYNVNSIVVEKRVNPTPHPQAHFINARTMEIIHAHFPHLYDDIISHISNSEYWRCFSYCYSLCGNEFERVDHFASKEASILRQLTPSNIAHLPQSLFETICRKHIFENSFVTGMFGKNVTSIVRQSDGTYDISGHTSQHDTGAQSPQKFKINCNYVIGADGASSFVRKHLNVDLLGEKDIHTLMNIHFSIRNKIIMNRPAMLYFVYNENMVGVFVAHDIANNEWVCQIPIFPPYTDISDFTEKVAKEVILLGIGTSQHSVSPVPHPMDITIHSIRSWKMSAVVAERFQKDNIFLVGDSAHQFPPAGGFGMNTGIQDAHNLAWKIGLVHNNICNKELLLSYHPERHFVAKSNTKLSLENYEKTAAIARGLGVDPKHATAVITTVSRTPLLPAQLKQHLVKSALALGLSSLAYLRSEHVLGRVRINAIQKLIRSGNSLSLIFPENDINFQYPSNQYIKHVVYSDGSYTSTTDSSLQNGKGVGGIIVGRRIPHIWLRVQLQNSSEGKQEQSILLSTVLLGGHISNIIRNSRNYSIDDPLLGNIMILIDEPYRPNLLNILKELYLKSSEKRHSIPFTVVGIHGNGASSSNSSEIHNYLQNEFQYPHYTALKTDNKYKNSSSSKNSSEHRDTIQSTDYIANQNLFNNSLYVDMLRDSILENNVSVDSNNTRDSWFTFSAFDIANRWVDMFQGGSNSLKMTILRPDGHVIGVCCHQTPSNKCHVDSGEYNRSIIRKCLLDTLRGIHMNDVDLG